MSLTGYRQAHFFFKGFMLREIGTEFWGQEYFFDKGLYDFSKFRKLYKVSGYYEWKVFSTDIQRRMELFEVVKKQESRLIGYDRIKNELIYDDWENIEIKKYGAPNES